MTPETVEKSLTSLDWLRTLNPTALTQNIHSYHLATHSRNNSASIPSHNQYQQQQHHPSMYQNNRQPQHVSVQNGSGPQNDQPTHYAVNGIMDSTSATAAALADDASIEETLELMKAQVAQQEGRPSFSYSTLIAVAIKYNKKGKLTLGEIYQWIADNFPYYQTAGPSWKNSIRHNLSFNKLFIRVPREPNDPGKGAYWALNPNPATNGTSSLFSDLKDNGRKKRRKEDEGSGSLSPSSAPRSSVPPLASPKQQEPKLQHFPIVGQHFGSSVSNGQGTTIASSIAPLLHQPHQPQLPQAFGHFNDNFGQSLSLTTILYPQTQYNANASINGGILNFPSRDNFSQAAGIGPYPSQVSPPNNYAMFVSNSQDPSTFGQFLNASNKNGLIPTVAPIQNTENIKRNGEMDAKVIAADALANLSFSNNQFMNMSHWNKHVDEAKAPSSKESSAKSHNPSQTSLISNKVKSVPVDDEEAYDYDTLID